MIKTTKAQVIKWIQENSLSDEDLKWINLSNTNISYADLQGANISYTNLSNVKFKDNDIYKNGKKVKVEVIIKEVE